MARYPSSCTLKWTGHASSENVGNLSYDYTKGTLNMGALLSGTPIQGWACSITVTPMNFKFKSGYSTATLVVDGSNFGTTLIIPVTPKTEYQGKQLDFHVGISAAVGSVLTAKVGW